SPFPALPSLLLSARRQADSDISFLNRVIPLKPSWTSTRTLQSKRLPDALIWDGSASLKHYKDEELYGDYDSNMVTAEG
ncbi:hypothetical protein KUCAC02_031441, partial [Chaenocephalus aceratus]